MLFHIKVLPNSDFKQEIFLRKPIETEDLVHAIKKFLGSG